MSCCCNILRLRGLPFEVDANEIETFFDDYELVCSHIVLRGGKPTGEAYVQFKDAEEANKALKEKQREHIGIRYIEIFEAGEAQLVARVTQGENSQPSLEGHVVRLRGLPFTSSAEDVLDFFQPTEPVGGSRGVIFTCTPDGRPTGEAFIELASPEDKEVALSKHKELLGTRYIEVFESTKGGLLQAVQQRGFFTCVEGKREHHPPLPAPGSQTPSSSHGQGSVSGGGGTNNRPRGSSTGAVEGMAQSFGAFGLSSRYDRQVPGPRRLPGPHPPSAPYTTGGVGETHYPASRAATTGWAPIPTIRPTVFDPAPGPPGQPGVMQGPARGGGRQAGPATAYDYNRQAVLMTPFMVQHPFMQQQASPWGYLPQPQGSPWFGSHMAPGRGGMAPGQYHTGYAYQGYYQQGNVQGQHQRQQGQGAQSHYYYGARHSNHPGAGTNQQHQAHAHHAGSSSGGSKVPAPPRNSGESTERHSGSGNATRVPSLAPPLQRLPDEEPPIGTPDPEDSARSAGSAESSGSVVMDQTRHTELPGKSQTQTAE